MQPRLANAAASLELCCKLQQMAKRYSESEKRNLIASYLQSGQSYAAYARVCGVSAITLKTWQSQYSETKMEGFVAISAPLVVSDYGFRLSIGSAILDFERLPPVDWVSSFLKLMSR